MMIRSFSCRAINRLSTRKVATLKPPGRHSDGNNLYLVIDPSGARWLSSIHLDAPIAMERRFGTSIDVLFIVP